jgi:hypothetical protein
MTPISQGGTQDKIESMKVIGTCTVVESDEVFADIAESVLRIGTRPMRVQAKTSIVEHLGRQHQGDG